MSAIECSAVEFATIAWQSNRDHPDALIRAVKEFMSPHTLTVQRSVLPQRVWPTPHAAAECNLT